MLRVNKKLEYAILALLYLASKPHRVASVREISSDCHIPEALLSKIMQTLKASGFVAALHGNQGGYCLTCDLASVSLFDLMQNIVRDVGLVDCIRNRHGMDDVFCTARPNCALAAPMRSLNQRIVQLFRSTSLKELAMVKGAQ
ncbi:MAG: Rrf2 family transcriptional regulator [Deltaproteobacteria bacterium]|nr:Rrf2 family transcriptional regulator [Deltaproteobacteria bacterium]